MFEAYAIGVTLKLNNLISAQLTALATEFEKLDGLVIGLNRSLKAIGGEAASLRKIASAGNATSVAMEKAALNTERLERRLNALRINSLTPINNPIVPVPGGGGGRPSGGGGGGGHGGRGGFHGGNIHMGPGGFGVSSVGMAAGDLFWPLAITGGMLWGGHSLYEAAKDLNTEQQRFKLFGLSDKTNKEAFDYVAGLNIYGMSQAENMKHFREAQGVFRESGLGDSEALAAAKLATPILGKIAFATGALDEESKARMRTSSVAMLRWIEMNGGQKDPEKFKALADTGWKISQTSGGTVDWEQLRQFTAIGGVTTQNLTNEALAGLEPIISELKGGGAATGLRTAFNRLTGVVRLPNQIAHELVKQGLWDPHKVEFNSHGGIKRFNGNPMASMPEFLANPEQWYYTHILPMYDRMHLTDAERLHEDAMLFGSTGGRLFSKVRTQRQTIDQSVVAFRKALGLGDSNGKGEESLSGQEKEFSAAWKDFKTQFGTVMLPAFTTILKDGAVVLRAIGNFFGIIKQQVDDLKLMRDQASKEAPSPTGIYQFNPVHGRGGGISPSHVTVQIDGEDVRHRVLTNTPVSPSRGNHGLNPQHSPLSPGLGSPQPQGSW